MAKPKSQANEQAGNEQSFCVHFKRPDLGPPMGDCPNQIVVVGRSPAPHGFFLRITLYFSSQNVLYHAVLRLYLGIPIYLANLTFSFFQNSKNLVCILGALSFFFFSCLFNCKKNQSCTKFFKKNYNF